MNQHTNLIHTFLSKSISLGATFIIVLLSIKIWGTAGRGYISYIMADTAILSIICNLFVGSTFTFHRTKYELKQLVPVSITWIILVSVLGGIVFRLIQGISVWPIVGLTFITSFSALITNHLLSQLAFEHTNRLTNTYNLLFAGIITVIYLLDIPVNRVVYFISYIVAYILAMLPVVFKIFKNMPWRAYRIEKQIVHELFKYGFMNELSYFLQFLNYRVSYFFIANYLGIKSLGVFGVAVVFSESIWVISNSISTIQYATIINQDNRIQSLALTKKYSLYSALFSIFAICILLIIPDSLFTFLFNSDYKSIHTIFVCLAPGILAIGISTIYGHFFAAIAQQKILVIKSFIGLCVAIVTTPLFLKQYGNYGVALSMSASYLVSSLILFIAFYYTKNQQTGVVTRE